MRKAQRQDDREGGAFRDAAAVAVLGRQAGGHKFRLDVRNGPREDNPQPYQLRGDRVRAWAWQPFGGASGSAERLSEPVDYLDNRAAQDRLVGMKGEFRALGEDPPRRTDGGA